MLNSSVIRRGSWSPNLIRNLTQLKDVKLRYACGINNGRLKYVKRNYLVDITTKDYQDVVNGPVKRGNSKIEKSFKSSYLYILKKLQLVNNKN